MAVQRLPLGVDGARHVQGHVNVLVLPQDHDLLPTRELANVHSRRREFRAKVLEGGSREDGVDETMGLPSLALIPIRPTVAGGMKRGTVRL